MSAQYSTAWPYPDSFYAYDPARKRVMKETNPDPRNLNKGSNPLFEFYIYGITGQRLVTVDCNYSWQNPVPNCWVVGENVYFGSKLLVSNGVNVVTDRLGSVRANTQGERFAYYPYGEERTSTVDGRDKFGTYFRDGAGQDYADQRYYNSSMGRFWTADPAGVLAANPLNPASWNRYAYSHGDPANLSDAHGTAPCGDADGERPCPALLEDEGGGCDPDQQFDVAWGLASGDFLETGLSSGQLACYLASSATVLATSDFVSTPPPTITLREIDDCILPSGTGINPGTWTLFVKYQVLENGKPIYGSDLRR